MARAWPWRTDTTHDRLRRIAESYRTGLKEIDPEACRLIDARMIEFGQHWIVDSDMIVNVEDLVTAQQVAEEFGFAPWNVHDWSRRHPDMIPKRGRREGKTLYRLGDILAYQASCRRSQGI